MGKNRYGKLIIEIPYETFDISESYYANIDNYIKPEIREFIKDFNIESLKECIFKFGSSFALADSNNGLSLDLANCVLPCNYYYRNIMRFNGIALDENDNIVYYFIYLYYDKEEEHVIMSCDIKKLGDE